VGSSPPSRAKKEEIDMLKKFVNYCKACYSELAHKTTWPTRRELTHSAMVVLSASLVIALVVFAMDSLFRFIMTTVYPG
jgi:preprotein translocase subunit SecE